MTARSQAFIWGMILTSLFWQFGTSKYYTFYAVTTQAQRNTGARGESFDIYWNRVMSDRSPQARLEWRKTAYARDWWYSDLAGILLAPVGWFPRNVSYVLWTLLTVGSYLLIVKKLLEVDYDWIIALITLKPFLLLLVVGNIGPFLALLSLSPIGMLVACVFKCYCAGFLLLFAVQARYRTKRDESFDRPGYADLPGFSVAYT